MSSLRIAYVLGTTSGGTGRHVAMLAAACLRAGCQVAVFGPQPAGDSAVEFTQVAITDRPRPASDLAVVRRLRGLLSGWSPDVVHAHGLRAGAVAALALPSRKRARAGVLRSRVPLVVTVHNAPPAGVRLAVIYAVLERVVARRADVVLCVSPDLQARMRRLGARSVACAIVPAPLPAPAQPRQEPGSAQCGAVAELVTPGRPIVLGVGRLAPQKDFATLLAAAAGWRVRQPAPLVVIAGDGPLAGALAARAAELGVDARFLGSRDDVADLLAVTDVFVLPSRWEGQPLILSEALRAGRPIVATDVGGVRALLGLAGPAPALLVPAADPVALGAAVLSVLDDPELAARLSAAALARAARLPSEADAVAAALAVYRELAHVSDSAAG